MFSGKALSFSRHYRVLHIHSVEPRQHDSVFCPSPNSVTPYCYVFHETLALLPLTLPTPPTTAFQGSQRPGRTQPCQSWYLSPGLSRRYP